MTEPTVLSVSDLNQSARRLLEERFNLVWIRGEISNFARPRSGHWYFTLKDDAAQVRCAMFVNRNRLCRMQPSDGGEVLLRGRVSLYENRGEFQVIVEHMEAAGEGALRAAYEALKARLTAEGLFAEERKRALPAYPRHLAVVSSPSGAALRDVLSVIRRRFPLLEVTLLPVSVQGVEAEPQILDALNRVPALAPDLVLLTRGGGSLEDLFTFNSEAVARAIARCPVPTVSAVGHETDFTIADFAADLRAPTPSAAAELITPDAAALTQDLGRWRQRLIAASNNRLELLRHRHAALRSRLVNPRDRLLQLMQRADDLETRLRLGLGNSLERTRTRFASLQQGLERQRPEPRIAALTAAVAALQGRAERRMAAQLTQNADRLSALARTLEAVSPLQALARGFAIVTGTGTDTAGAITNAAAVEAGDSIQVNFHDGALQARVERQAPLPEQWRALNHGT